MFEVEGIGGNILGGIMFSEGVRVVGVLLDCDRLVQHGENETLDALLVRVDECGVAFCVERGIL
jgi:hypothetical protein